MSCRELERLFVAGAPGTELASHRRSCAECERLGEEIDRTTSLSEGLRPPAWSPSLRTALLDIPRQTVACEGAERLLAEALEGEIASGDDRRLQGHLSRCPACTEAAAVLFSVRDLEAPAPPAWLATRLAASRPEVKRAGWRRLFSGKAVVAYAYALALVVMLLGWNPTAAAAGKAGFARLSVSTLNVVTVAQHSLSDRLGAVQEKTARKFAVWRGHVFGYGRAAVSNALAIVWRPEAKKAPTRPRLGKDGGNSTGFDGFTTAGAPRQELFPAGFRV